jgi:predicted N-acetyltransferase YhbS
MAVTDGLSFRSNYFSDFSAFQALADLLADTFGIDISLQNLFGGPDPTSMPFGYFDASGRCVANFSVFSLPVIIAGRAVKAAGYQSGAVRPEYRGKGLYRDLMRRGFDWAAKTGHDTGVLRTDKPDLYKLYGFQVIDQHVFRGPSPAPDRDTAPARRLDLNNPHDMTAITDLLRMRTPVSHRFAVLAQAEMFLLNCLFDPTIRLSHMEAQNAVIAWKQDDDSLLRLLDIVALDLPCVETILGALERTPAEIEVSFPPDQIGWSGEPEPYLGSCALLMAGKGLDFLPSTPFMLTPLADF